MAMKYSRLLVIGLDGMTFDLYKQYKARGIFKNITEMMNKGVYGNLKSVIPTDTVPAWACFYTGKNPGKIGVYGTSKKESFGARTVSSKDVKSRKIWNYLNENGYTTGLFAIPLTYPPEPVSGFMVSGMLTPDIKSNFTYPEELKEEILRISPSYRVSFEVKKSETIMDAINRSFEARVKVATYLLGKRKCDFVMVVFNETDWMEHFMWKYIDKNHPFFENNKKKEEEVIDFLRQVDKAIGDFKNLFSSDTNIIIMSDHGAGILHGHFNINDWLIQNGYLAMRKKQKGISKGLAKIGITREKLLAISLKLGLRELTKQLPFWIRRSIPEEKNVIEWDDALAFNYVDWEKTKAWALGNGIYINTKNPEEYIKIRNNILNDIKNLKPPVGNDLNITIYKKEDLFSGDYLDGAPDLIPLFGEYKFLLSTSIGNNDFFTFDKVKRSRNASHRLNGIFIAYGPDIKGGGKKLEGTSILDLAPTILHMYNVPVPEDMDGKVLKEIFKGNSEPRRREVKYQRAGKEGGERGKIKERIRKLKVGERI
ncbi:hypothetical protein CW713_00450 [Methanophagales archaeon]|nr:MAG: hypothetical protein CW713_00450 [Methanophagales archaeon]